MQKFKGLNLSILFYNNNAMIIGSSANKNNSYSYDQSDHPNQKHPNFLSITSITKPLKPNHSSIDYYHPNNHSSSHNIDTTQLSPNKQKQSPQRKNKDYLFAQRKTISKFSSKVEHPKKQSRTNLKSRKDLQPNQEYSQFRQGPNTLKVNQTAYKYRQVLKEGKWVKVVSRYKVIPSKMDDNVRKFMKIERLNVKSSTHNNQPSQKPNYYSYLNKTIENILNQYQQESAKERNTGSILLSTNNYALFPSQIQQKSKTKRVPRSSNNFKQKNKHKQQFIARKPSIRREYFVFGMNQRSTPQNRVEFYRDFLWKINFSNNIHVETPKQLPCPYRIYVGYGNNSNLIKNIMRRRSWWIVIEDDSLQSSHPKNGQKWKDFNFVWTQIKVDKFFQFQSRQQRQLVAQCISHNKNFNNSTANDDEHKRIFGTQDLQLWRSHCEMNKKYEDNISDKTYIKRIDLYSKKKIKQISSSKRLKVQNHLPTNYFIGNKKALFYNIKQYFTLKNADPFTIIPITYHINDQGVLDPEFAKFKAYYLQLQNIKRTTKNENDAKVLRNIWIVKPGENTNQGAGITVCYNIDDILARIKSKERNPDGSLRTYIIQKYLQNPFLYNNRKFDIRHYLLISCINGRIKAYWYQDGYLRTSSSEFSLKYTKDLNVHLTNDSIQKKGDLYGKYEKGNKLSYKEFQRYLEKTQLPGQNSSFYDHVLPSMKRIALEAVKSSYRLLDKDRKAHNFQLLGLDYMLDCNLNPYLIEINTNPCLEMASPLLERILPELIQNTFKITIDPLFPPPESWKRGKRNHIGEKTLNQNKYELIFDESSDGSCLEQLYRNTSLIDKRMGAIDNDCDVFEENNEIIGEDAFQNVI